MNPSHPTNEPNDTQDVNQQIAQRAHELYEQRGRQDGFALQDWLQAEQELSRRAEDLPKDQFLVKKAI